jgi:hypothetical protein
VIITAVRLVYQDYDNIPWKYKLIYNSAYQKTWRMTVSRTAVHSVTSCCWPAVNKAVSPCELSIILVQLLLEHPVQVIHTTVDGETKRFKCKIYTVHYMYTVDWR